MSRFGSKRSLWMVVLAGLALLAACAHGAPPAAELAAAERALSLAELAGASRHAGAELGQARTKLAAARRAVAEGDNDRAWLLAVQARIDAEVAESTARAEVAEANADRLRRRLRASRRVALAEALD